MSLTVDSTGNPIVVTGTTSTSSEVSGVYMYVKFIRWYKPTTTGHLLSVTNKHGARVTLANCEAANETEDIPIFCGCDGIYIDDMDSGTVLIYRQ